MLGLIFSISVASTLIWLVTVYKYILENIGFEKLLGYSPADLFTIICAIIIPIALIWIIATFVIQALSNVKHNRWLRRLLKQSKTSIEYSEAVTRTMIEATGQVRSGFIMNKIDFTISDLNEIISEIISRANIKTKGEILDLWKLNKYGSKWGFSKAFLEYTQINEEYNQTIFDKCVKDKLLAGSVLEFCSKYIRLIEVLEKHDKEKLTQESFENGVMGRVFSILAPIADKVQNKSSYEEVKVSDLPAGIETPDEVEPLIDINKKDEEIEVKEEKKCFLKSIFCKKKKEKIEPVIENEITEPIIEETREVEEKEEIDIFKNIDDAEDNTEDLIEEIKEDTKSEEIETEEIVSEEVVPEVEEAKDEIEEEIENYSTSSIIDDIIKSEEEKKKEEEDSNFQSAESYFSEKEKAEKTKEENIDIEEYIDNIDEAPVNLDDVSTSPVTEENPTEEEGDETDPNREKMIADLQKQWEEIKNNQ